MTLNFIFGALFGSILTICVCIAVTQKGDDNDE